MRCGRFLRATESAGTGAGSLGILSPLPGCRSAATDEQGNSIISTATTMIYKKKKKKKRQLIENRQLKLALDVTREVLIPLLMSFGLTVTAYRGSLSSVT